jgi:nucleotide-binding universal stress UspA family protein
MEMIKPLFSNIVVAVSGSDASILAAKYAIVMAKTCRCRLSAVYVVDTATIRQLTLSKIFIQEESQEYEHGLQANGERYLSFVEELALAKGIKIERELRKGAVYTEILTVAEEKKADLIILGGWEKDRNPRDIFSHAHREIMINSRCTVLLAKEPGIDQIYKQV